MQFINSLWPYDMSARNFVIIVSRNGFAPVRLNGKIHGADRHKYQ